MKEMVNGIASIQPELALNFYLNLVLIIGEFDTQREVR